MTFEQSCRQIAQRFLKTVVIIDDQAFQSEASEPEPEAVSDPTSRGYEPLSDAERAAEPAAPVQDPRPRRGLNLEELSRRFAFLGIACSAYAPRRSERLGCEGESDEDGTARLARHADVVVVDWFLDAKRSDQARAFIRCILDTDRREGGCLRLIAVYTGETGLRSLRDDLLADLRASFPDLRASDEGGQVALVREHVRIAFLNKEGGGSEGDRNTVKEAELPERLVTEFTSLTMGIMPAVALDAISSIRDGTHHLLAKFGSHLDGALAAHRAMLRRPDDVMSYASDLVAEELRSLLERDGPQHPASFDVMAAWVDHEQKPGRFQLGDGQRGDYPLASAKALLSNIELKKRHEEAGKAAEPPVGVRGLWERLPHLYCGAGRKDRANHAFSRMASLKREAFGTNYLPEGWTPVLGLGSLLLEPADSTVHVCLQAACDSVGVKDDKRKFPLLPLDQLPDSRAAAIAIMLPDGTPAWLAPNLHPYESTSPYFAVDQDRRAVVGLPRATRKFVFRSAPPVKVEDGPQREFIWLGELRSSVAQRIAHELASRVGRVGLDEYDWLRRMNAERASTPAPSALAAPPTRPAQDLGGDSAA